MVEKEPLINRNFKKLQRSQLFRLETNASADNTDSMSKVVVADYDYDGADESQLTFKEGDRIVVLEEDESGWFLGRLENDNQEGYFPATYVKDVEPTTQPEEEYEDVDIAAPADDADAAPINSSAGADGGGGGAPTKLAPGKPAAIKTHNNKRYQMAKNISVSAPSANGPSISVDEDAKEGQTPAQTTGTKSPSIDYHNYFANTQKVNIAVSAVPDNFDGEGGAALENYYAAEVLNLKFNPNAKSRYGLVAHYMSLFSSVSTFFLSTSAWAWYNGSPYLEEKKLASYNACLYIGLYAFFMSLIMFPWEYFRGFNRRHRMLPWRGILYLCLSIPLFVTLVTALAGVLWLNAAIASTLAWYLGEEYEETQKKAYSDEKVLSPKERLLQCVDCKRAIENWKLRWLAIRQQSQGKKYLFLAIYVLFNVVYCIYWAAYYSAAVKLFNEAAAQQTNIGDALSAEDVLQIVQDNTRPGDEPIVLTDWFPLAKMFGNLLDINCAFILLPVCRSFISQLYNISTDQRAGARCCNFILSFMPLDKALEFHKLCAFLVVVGTIFHTWAHYNHFAAVPGSYEFIYGVTVWISGSLIIVCMELLYCTSFAAVRHGKFETFWYTHHLFVIFFLSILFHGAGSVNPNFWKWFLVPGILYIIERSMREFRARQAVGVVSVLHMNNKNARIFCLELEKTGPIRNHQEGQYVFINAPIVSKWQWHPFTISSPPDQKTLTLHIRNMGDGSWTDRLQQFFQAVAPGKAYTELYHRDGDILVPQTTGPDGNNLICIDGPMAAPTQHLGEYSTSIVIGAGIGVTPVRSTLQSIIYYRFRRGIGQTFPDQAYCVWLVNHSQLDAYRFMCRSLKEAEDELYMMKKKNPKQMQEKVLQIHIFVTSTPKTEEAWKKYRSKESDVSNPDNDRQKDLALWGTHYDDAVFEQRQSVVGMQAPFTEVDIWNCLKEPSDEPTQIGDIIIHKGRPKWDQFFGPIQAAHRGHRIGVMYCGPDIIAQDLTRACGEYTDFKSKTVFILHKENF